MGTKVNEAAIARSILKNEDIIGAEIVVQIKKVMTYSCVLTVKIISDTGEVLNEIDDVTVYEDQMLTIQEPRKMFQIFCS